MADSSDQRTPLIPDWQKNNSQSAHSTAPSNHETETHSETPNRDLISQAKRFLEQESIRDAPREQKVEFLKKKGLQPDDIQSLLDEQPTSISPTSTPDQQPDMKTVHDSTLHPDSSASPQASSPPAPPPSRDAPPIITYPEFLLHPSKPPPLVTFQRLAYAAYGLASLSALTYGASEYLVKPMLESLTSARHDFASHTTSHLQLLNDKLESSVSHVPYTSSSILLKHKAEDDDDDDVETIDSDPTELFHRDIATQTSPLLNSTSTSTTSLNPGTTSARDPTAFQSARLSSIRTSLSTLHREISSTLSPLPPTPSADDIDTSRLRTFHPLTLATALNSLQAYLDRLQYSGGLGAYEHLIAKGKKSGTGGDEDEVDKFKSEIRAVKGALLSNRNFPMARPALGIGR